MKKGWSSFMDRRVKERLVGATILLVLAVLIVPELLSGPKHSVNTSPALQVNPQEPIRNVTVDLATNKPATMDDAGASTAVSAAPEEGQTAASAAAPPTIATLQAQPPAAPAAATPTVENAPPNPRSAQGAPKPVPRAAPPRDVAADAAHRRWAAQIGSFSSRANAEKLEHRLKAQSFTAYIVASGSGRSLLYRVRVGPLPDRAATERVIARLRKEGLPASVVTP
jgi:DedD protein